MDAIGGQRPHAWAKTWARDGHEVDVLTVTKDTPFTQRADFTVHEVAPAAPFTWLKRFYRTNLKDGAGAAAGGHGTRGWYVRLRLLGLGTSTRMPDASDFWILPALARARALGQKWDVVVSTFGPYSTHLVAWRLRQQGLAGRWVADFRDLWTLNPYFTGLPVLKHVERALEKLILRDADLVITVSPPLAEQMRALHPATPVRVVENGADVDDFSDEPRPARGPKCTIIYAGTIYEGRRDPSPLLRALVRLESDAVEVIFAGPSSAEVQRLIARAGAERYARVIGLVPRAEALALQRGADVLLFLESRAPDAAGVLTGKLFEYLFSGVEIWGVGIDHTTLSGQIITATGCGAVFGDDEAALGAALARLVRDGGRAVVLPAEFREKYDRRAQARRLLSYAFPARIS